MPESVRPAHGLKFMQGEENGELGLNPDTTPTAGSTNLVTSGGVYEAINTAINEAVGTALGGSY